MYALTYFPIISLIVFCLTDFKLVIILQFALILIYVFNYKNRFNKFRVFLTKSTKSFSFYERMGWNILRNLDLHSL